MGTYSSARNRVGRLVSIERAKLTGLLLAGTRLLGQVFRDLRLSKNIVETFP